MALHIANPEVCALVKRLAQACGVSMSQAVNIAVKEALALRADERFSADVEESHGEQPA